MPNFFIVGAPKCGTTAWVEYLESHPDICFSSAKEPHFFNTDFPGFRWANSLDEYLLFFNECEGTKVIGEASVQYLYSNDSAKNIAEISPSAKILIFLRSPSSFLRSYHNQLLINCDEDEPSLRKAWDASGKRKGKNVPKECREPAFLDYKKVGLFSEQVERYLKYFPSNQTKVVFFEEWIKSPRQVYLEVMEFLDVVDDGRTDFLKVHGAKKIRFRRLHQLTQRPPLFLRRILSIVRKFPGLSQVRPSRFLRSLNVQNGYASSIDTDIEAEIDDYFYDDQKRLRAILRMHL